MRFPLVGSATLLTAYALIKIFGRVVLNYIFVAYFSGFGVMAIAGALEAEVAAFFLSEASPYAAKTLGVTVEREGTSSSLRRLFFVAADYLELSKKDKDTLDLHFSAAQAMCFVVAVATLVTYWLSKHWLLNNAIAACLCLSGLEMINIGSFRNAAIMLTGLFLYDIFFVFGTEVMVTVAKGVDGPIKLLFPRTFGDEESKFSMLGLGDVVVPGFAVALLLRFDAHRAFKKQGGPLNPGLTFAAPYFLAALLAYVAGLALTLGVMYAFDAAQPALLYLVPAVLGAVLALALVRGELAELTTFDDDDDPPKAKEEDGGDVVVAQQQDAAKAAAGNQTTSTTS
mmetsp:Transcript_23805/g.73257  ORF Transcript_23805/g.73257 Transcript_23805/m.73257 type:complete len:341 (-) Transcript_23805:1547-2569(-)